MRQGPLISLQKRPILHHPASIQSLGSRAHSLKKGPKLRMTGVFSFPRQYKIPSWFSHHSFSRIKENPDQLTSSSDLSVTPSHTECYFILLLPNMIALVPFSIFVVFENSLNPFAFTGDCLRTAIVSEASAPNWKGVFDCTWRGWQLNTRWVEKIGSNKLIDNK